MPTDIRLGTQFCFSEDTAGHSVLLLRKIQLSTQFCFSGRYSSALSSASPEDIAQHSVLLPRKIQLSTKFCFSGRYSSALSSASPEDTAQHSVLFLRKKQLGIQFCFSARNFVKQFSLTTDAVHATRNEQCVTSTYAKIFPAFSPRVGLQD
jgi:hypothetical protein